jgi:hypothetical protein
MSNRLETPSTLVHDSLNLYISNDTITLEPVYSDPMLPRQTLVFSRQSGDIRINAPPAPTLRQEEVITVFAVVGIVSLNSGKLILNGVNH